MGNLSFWTFISWILDPFSDFEIAELTWVLHCDQLRKYKVVSRGAVGVGELEREARGLEI